MKVLLINTVYPNGSTGKICDGIRKQCQKSGIESCVAYAYGVKKNNNNELHISSWLDNHIHNRLARITMFTGCFSYFHTRRFLKKVTEYAPDIIHLHNLHGNFININLLFEYIKKTGIPVVWTLHDCWAYTGYCTYYEMASCNKWEEQCGNCPNRNLDSVTLFDNSKKMYEYKKNMFSNIKNLILVTPSKWLNMEVRKSFLQHYQTRIINNGIDLSIFHPIESNLRQKYNIATNKVILLGVAFRWNSRKGLDVFIELSKRLPNKYQIILVGTDDVVDEMLPKNIISIHRTSNQQELAEIYSAADIFVNPTREEMFGLVNIEALACGTPVITFDTGGSPECIDETCGSVIPTNDVDALTKEIIHVSEEKSYSEEACINRAKQFDMHERFQEYIELYNNIV